jgi:hypothetical protein
MRVRVNPNGGEEEETGSKENGAASSGDWGVSSDKAKGV